ncbi:hypothetical protein WDW37_03830 [Bdellovibrionota bacterium FG-1]
MVSKKQIRFWITLVFLGGLIFALSGCDVIPPEYEKQWIRLQKEWNAFVTVLSGGSSPLAKSSPSPAASSVGGDGILGSPNAKMAKANAELLQEVYRIVFMHDPKDRSEFGSLVDSLNQGASFEGIYNGFVHSTEYRKVEMTNTGSSPEALKLFGEELALLEMELPKPIEFDSSQGEVNRAAEVNGSATPVDAKALADRYTKQFVGASIYTLKRILGDEALRVMSVKREYPEKMAHWYSQWVIHMVSRGVDFGVSLRNSPDEQFHYKWALSASEDRVKWEVLNRLHRLINAHATQ